MAALRGDDDGLEEEEEEEMEGASGDEYHLLGFFEEEEGEEGEEGEGEGRVETTKIFRPRRASHACLFASTGSGGANGSVLCVDAASLEPFFMLPNRGAHRVRKLSDEEIVVTSTDYSRLAGSGIGEVLSTIDGRRLHKLRHPKVPSSERMSTVGWSLTCLPPVSSFSDTPRVAIGDDIGRVGFWDPQNGKFAGLLHKKGRLTGSVVYSIAHTPEWPTELYTGTYERIKKFDLTKRKYLRCLQDPEDHDLSLGVGTSPAHGMIFSSSGYVYSRRTCECIGRIKLFSRNSAAYSLFSVPDLNLVLYGCSNITASGTIKVGDVRSLTTPIREFKVSENDVWDFARVAQDEFIAASWGSAGHGVRKWTINGKCLGGVPKSEFVYGVASVDTAFDTKFGLDEDGVGAEEMDERLSFVSEILPKGHVLHVKCGGHLTGRSVTCFRCILFLL